MRNFVDSVIREIKTKTEMNGDRMLSRETPSNEVASTSLAHPYQIAGKIPGFIPPLPKQGSQGYIEDLSSKQKFELEEILERQNKLLRNKKFVSNLPDKGAKIINFRDKILKEIALKNEIDAAATLLSRLNVASEGKAAMNELEWTGKYSEIKSVEKIVELDSDDEEDPLKILAQPTGSGHHKKKIIHVPAEESLIKPEDLQDLDISNDQKQTEHVKYIVNKVEKTKVHGEQKVKESFKPYKTTVSNVHDPAKELGRKRDGHWEVTAATPPPSLHGIVKAIDINESLSLQRKQAEALTEILEKHAAERLAEQLGLHRIGNVPRITSGYRTMPGESSSSSSSDAEVNDVEDEEHEVHDEGDTDKAGTVVFPIHN